MSRPSADDERVALDVGPHIGLGVEQRVQFEHPQRAGGVGAESQGVADAFVLAGIALPWDVALVSRSAVPAVRVLH